jgi:hypothetical protein
MAMSFEIPESLRAEHEELHAELIAAIESGGAVGDAAKAVGDLLHPHFVKEEAYALPPLGLLGLLAKGEVRPEMAQVLAMTDKLRSELPNIAEAVEEVWLGARSGGRLWSTERCLPA